MDHRLKGRDIHEWAAHSERLQEALSWALDALEIALKRIDTVDGPLSDEHIRIRAAGIAKARAALAPGTGLPVATVTGGVAHWTDADGVEHTGPYKAEDHRDPACVERWPGCAEGEYHPDCCRFPKSCSCMSTNVRDWLASGGAGDTCTNCDGVGRYVGWPHTTCPVCEGTGIEPGGGG
jgi:hypothetical protein